MFNQFLLSTISFKDLDINKLRLVNPFLGEHLEELIDIIIARLSKANLEEISTDLFPNVFKLRIEVMRTIQSLETFDKLVEEFDTILVASSNQLIVNIFRDFQNISKQIVSNPLTEIDLSKLELSYETLKYLSTSIPNFFYVKEMIDASLHFEFGLMVYQLMEGEKIKTDEQLKEQLVPFMQRALKDFGTKAILSNLWNPTSFELNNPTFNRMKIKASIINAEKGDTTVIDADQLNQMLAS